MNTLKHTFIILFAAALIALGWYAFSTSSASQLLEPPDRSAEFSQMAGTSPESSPDRPAHPEGEEMGFALSRVLGGTAILVGQFGLIIGVVALIRKVSRRFSPTTFKLNWFYR